MAESCLLPKYFPKFHLKTPYSFKFVSLKEIPRIKLTLLFSELGCLLGEFESCHSINNIVICENHFLELKNRDYNRQRSVKYMLPSCLAVHSNFRKQERRLIEQHVQQIFLTTGIVLPIGTGICHSCRVEVLKDNPNVAQGRKLSFTHEGSVPDLLEDTHDNAVPLKRARISETEVTPSALDDTDSEFQVSQETVSQLSQSSEASVSNSLKLESLNKFLSISGVSPVKELNVYIRDSSTRTQQRYISKAKQCMELMLSTICPGEEDFIKKAVFNDMSTKTMEENATLETLVEIYKRADSWTFQQQILTTIVKDKELQDVQKFSNQRAVDDHILLGNCSIDGSERLNVTERAKYIYASKIMQMYPSNKDKLPSVPSNDFNTNHNTYLPMGWALKETKARVTFNAQQKEFMVDKFNIGKVTGKKVDPYVAAEEMRMSGKFKRSEYLSGQHISSYFSRLFQQDKKTSSDDCVPALCEENKENVKTTIKHILS
ncbi:unnamed protein product [Mytilus coruscus]|uniref:Uncharacterized protein n=1 Tax=Mytilus coruscus TaxID=42192 RepID=A0A6J8CGE7_MYTCO|nr:unnamed protein product [Mytilus coruscus]